MKNLAFGVLLAVMAVLIAPSSSQAQMQIAGSCYVFNNDLSYGMTSGEVLELQKFLATEGAFTVELTGTFGPLTKSALAQYQSKNSIQATGYFGPLTRAAVNADCGEVLGEFAQVTSVLNTTFVSSSSPLTILTPASGEVLQHSGAGWGNTHKISWSPNPENLNIEAFLELKKGRVFQTVAKVLSCGKGSIIWCGGEVDTTPDNGVENRSYAKPGRYYLKIMDKITGEMSRTSKPIQIVKYGDYIDLSLTAHLDKNKRVTAKSHDNTIATPITVSTNNIILSWNTSFKTEYCQLNIMPDTGYDTDKNGVSTHSLARRGTKQTFQLEGGYGRYTVDMNCVGGTNAHTQTFDVIVEGAVKPAIIKVLSPNGGETFIADSSTIKIEGRVEGVEDGTKITAYLYHPEYGNVRSVVGSSTTAGTFSMETSLEKGGGHNPGDYKITMCADGYASSSGKDLCDSSDDFFKLVPGDSSGSCLFTRDLTVGSTGQDVVNLQSFLISRGFLTILGNSATGYFGASTQAALAQYQAALGFSPADGYFGPVVRAYIATQGCIDNSELLVELVDTPSPISPLANDESKGRFFVEFTVSAPNEDIYIPYGATTSPATKSGAGVGFAVVDSAGQIIYGSLTNNVSNVLRKISGASEVPGYYKISQGDRAVFSLEIIINNSGQQTAQTLGIQMLTLNYKTSTVGVPEKQYLNFDEEFRSDTAYLLTSNTSN